MRRFKVNWGFLILASAAALSWAQTAAEKPGVDVRRVGSHLACQCTGCKDTVATCSMLECSFSKPAKERIAKMQALGMGDRQIIDTFLREYGAGIYLAPPSLIGMLIPYLAAALGLGAIWWFINKYRPRSPLTVAGPGTDAARIDDPALAKYKDQIEKDLANLE